MFNEQDQRCTAVQIMLSTDSSCDNRTIASTLKMQIWAVQCAQGDEKVFGYGYGLWCGFKWWPHHAPSHLRNRLESQHQSVPGCAEECGDLLVQSGGQLQTLGVAAGLGAGPWVQRDPGLASEGVLPLCTLLSLGPLLPRPEPAGLLRLVIRREPGRPCISVICDTFITEQLSTKYLKIQRHPLSLLSTTSLTVVSVDNISTLLVFSAFFSYHLVQRSPSPPPLRNLH